MATNDNKVCDISFEDLGILYSVANSVNPCTGGDITGVDESLKTRLEEIAYKLKTLTVDNSLRVNIDKQEFNIKQSAKDVAKIIFDACLEISGVKYFGMTVLVNVLRGSKSQQILSYRLNELKCYGILKEIKTKYLMDIVEFLVEMKIFYRTQGLYPTLRVNNEKSIVDVDDLDVSFIEEALAENNAKKESDKDEGELTIEVDGFNVIIDEDGAILTDIELLNRLKDLRKELSKERLIPFYCIASNKLLVKLATKKPTNKEEFIELKGVGEKWFEINGRAFMREINSYLNGVE